MATSTRFGTPVPDATTNNNTPQVLYDLVQFIEANQPGVSRLTTAQRDALTGTALWDDRLIWNSTTDQLERYDGTGGVWVPAVTIPATDPGIASLTTAERNGLSGGQLWVGRVIYNKTDGRVQFYNGSVWANIAILAHSGLTGLDTGNDHPQYALLSGANFTGTVDLLRYVERLVNVTANSTTTTINLNSGTVYQVTLTVNTTFAISNPVGTNNRAQAFSLILKQDATGGRTVTWPAGVKWPDGAAPALSTAANAVNILTFITPDGGTTWYGFPSGRNMA